MSKPRYMITAETDIRNWKAAMTQYMQFCKKAPSEICNTKGYFIARNATMTTEHTTPEKIKSELSSPSKSYPEVPLGAILVNAQLGKHHKKGLTGRKMSAAVEKLYRVKKSSINFVRAGWIKTIKALQSFYERGDIRISRRYQPQVATGLKDNTRHHGGAIYALPNRDYTFAEIFNTVDTKKGGEKLNYVMEKGLKIAIDKEIQSMIVYIHQKFNSEHEKLNR